MIEVCAIVLGATKRSTRNSGIKKAISEDPRRKNLLPV